MNYLDLYSQHLELINNYLKALNNSLDRMIENINKSLENFEENTKKKACAKCGLLFSETDMRWDEITEKSYCHHCWELGEAEAEARMDERYSEPLNERDEYFLAH